MIFVILLVEDCVLYAWEDWCRAGTWLIILHILSYPRMLRPDCSARLAALQLLQSVPCDLWTNRSHRQGVSLDITLKTHTGHHIAHNNKNLNNRQKSSSISCSAEQIYSVPFYFSWHSYASWILYYKDQSQFLIKYSLFLCKFSCF